MSCSVDDTCPNCGKRATDDKGEPFEGNHRCECCDSPLHPECVDAHRCAGGNSYTGIQYPAGWRAKLKEHYGTVRH